MKQRQFGGPGVQASPQVRGTTGRPGSPAPLRVDVGNITLHGYAAGDRRRFAVALEAGLAELASMPVALAAPAADLTIRALDVGQLRPGATPEEAARQVAARILEGLAGARHE